jgi:hypothetical protein
MIYFVGPKEEGSPVRIFRTSKGRFPVEMELMREGNPREIHLLGMMRGGRLREYILHRRYNDHRIRADWFDGQHVCLDNVRLNQ